MLNLAALMGRLCNDPELRHTSNDVAVTSFTIANDQGSGDKKRTSFIDIVCWRNTAEFACKYFRKGQLVAVQGSIQTRTYTDKDGNKRKAVEIVADHVHFAESKKDLGNNNTYPARGSADIEADDFEEIPSDDDLPF